ncbi:hypothetical protein ABTD13_18130, partial [Acinetobacter baumannii]
PLVRLLAVVHDVPLAVLRVVRLRGSVSDPTAGAEFAGRLVCEVCHDLFTPRMPVFCSTLRPPRPCRDGPIPPAAPSTGPDGPQE